MAHDVFISYANKDKTVADAICVSLEGAGVRCWIAPRDIAAGEDWPRAITRALSQSRICVLIFSVDSNSSDQISRELGLAADCGLIIIPFKIDDVIPEPGKQYFLARTHWLDAVNPPTQEQINSLVSRVSTLLSSFSKNEKIAKVTAPSISSTERKEIIARQKAEEKARQEEQARQKKALLEEQNRRAAEERIQREAQIKARQAAEEKARQEAQEQEQRLAEQRNMDIARLQGAIEGALAGGEWAKARQLISQLKSLGPDVQPLVNYLVKRLPKAKIPGWVWAVGSLVLLAGIAGVVFLGMLPNLPRSPRRFRWYRRHEPRRCRPLQPFQHLHLPRQPPLRMKLSSRPMLMYDPDPERFIRS
jgi:hypothetical protein